MITQKTMKMQRRTSNRTDILRSKGEIKLKVVLKYTNGHYSQDAKTIMRIVSQYNVEVLKANETKVTIIVKDYNELNSLISALNSNCLYAVKVASVKFEESLLSRIMRVFE